eukprot:tig00000144_g9170.t1
MPANSELLDVPVVEIPMGQIRRPLIPILDEKKVCSLMETLQSKPEDVPPIDVLEVEGYPGLYYSFGGCHRWEAHTRIAAPTIKCRVKMVPPAVIRGHLGSSFTL